MKVLVWILGVLMAALVIVFGAQIVASETGEVVVLYTDEDGGQASTRLWVVDHDGHQWLRGSPNAGWLARLTGEPRVALERDGVTGTYLATPDPAMGVTINLLMKEKYGWREDVVSLLADRSDSVAIRLTPAEK